MNDRFSIETSNNITILRFFSNPQFSDIIDAVDTLTAADSSSDLRLWDFSNGLNLESSSLNEIADYVKKKLPKPAKVALVASEDLAYGLMRMYEVHRDRDLNETMVFRSFDEAYSWLERLASK